MENKLKHIAIIMDGNGRWAKEKSKPRIYGHSEGAKIAKIIIEEIVKLEIEYLTLYAFSNENWQRPKQEIGFLFELFIKYIEAEFENIIANNIRFKLLGEIDKLPTKLQQLIKDLENKSASNTGLNLNLAVNYGGRQEILSAVKKLIDKNIPSSELTEADITQNLYNPDLPDADLIIRTGKMRRLSNFLSWQSIYSELYFIDKFWPDFTKSDLHEAINYYNKTNRNFGVVNAD